MNEKFRPSEISILGNIYKINYVDTLKNTLTKEEKENKKKEIYILGQCSSTKKEIIVTTKCHYDDVDFPETTVMETLFHEIAHAMCGDFAYNSYDEDEPFIEMVGKNLLCIWKSGFYENKQCD